MRDSGTMQKREGWTPEIDLNQGTSAQLRKYISIEQDLRWKAHGAFPRIECGKEIT